MENFKEKYEEALLKAREWKNKYNGVTMSEDGTMLQDFNNIFPELKESEDERIRKATYMYVDQSPITGVYGYTKKDILAWLEKQEEIWTSIKKKEAMLDCQTCINYKKECNPDSNIFKCAYPIRHNGIVDANTENQDEQKPEWSEEDERYIRYLIHLLNQEKYNHPQYQPIVDEKIHWLKSLRPQNRLSDTDIRLLDDIYEVVEKSDLPKEDKEVHINFLQRLRPQKQWKPSDELMNNLMRAVNGAAYRNSLLRNLYEQLKNL